MNGDDKKMFFPYLLANYPSTARFLDVLDVTTKYADAIEIGIPFSDPVAALISATKFTWRCSRAAFRWNRFLKRCSENRISCRSR